MVAIRLRAKHTESAQMTLRTIYKLIRSKFLHLSKCMNLCDKRYIMLNIQKTSQSLLLSIVSIFFLITLFGLSNSRLYAKKPPSNDTLQEQIIQNIEQYFKQKFDRKDETKEDTSIKFEDYLEKDDTMQKLRKIIVLGKTKDFLKFHPIQNKFTKMLHKAQSECRTSIMEKVCLIGSVSSFSFLVGAFFFYMNTKKVYYRKDVQKAMFECREAINDTFNYDNSNYLILLSRHYPIITLCRFVNTYQFPIVYNTIKLLTLVFTCILPFQIIFIVNTYKKKKKENNDLLLIENTWEKWWNNMIYEIQQSK